MSKANGPPSHAEGVTVFHLPSVFTSSIFLSEGAGVNNDSQQRPRKQGRINAWTETFGKFLRVTYKEEGDRILVITAVKKKKRWG